MAVYGMFILSPTHAGAVWWVTRMPTHGSEPALRSSGMQSLYRSVAEAWQSLRRVSAAQPSSVPAAALRPGKVACPYMCCPVLTHAWTALGPQVGRWIGERLMNTYHHKYVPPHTEKPMPKEYESRVHVPR
jgi:hypothetical protein